MTVDALKAEIEKLPAGERSALVQWLSDREEVEWDEQIRADHRAGKLDELIGRARRELADGSIREAP